MIVPQRFLDKVVYDEATGCAIWTAAKNEKGYGLFRDNGMSIGAHRWIWLFLCGPVPEGYVIDHLCRNRACVNPAHLEPVTQRENVLRGESNAAQNARKDRCHKGHPFSPVIRTDGPNQSRRCEICARETKRAHYERSRAA